MKIIVTKTTINEALFIIGRGGGDITHLPILKNFLLETDGEKIKISSTNLEIGVSFYLSGKIIEKGNVSIPISIFSHIISNLPTERINLETKNNNLYIKTDNYEATIQGSSPDDFPIIPHIKQENKQFSLPSDILKEVFLQILPASQFSEIRPELNNIFIHFSPGEHLKFVATDSFRLAEKTLLPTQFTTTYTDPFSFLIPIKNCTELVRILKDGNTVLITHDTHQILFKTENCEFISRLSESTFPDYAAIIPKGFKGEFTFDKNEFINALKITSILSSKINEIKIKALDSKKAIHVISHDVTLGENTYTLPVKVKGDIHDVSFNWRYLLDGLKTLTKGDNLYMGINEDNKPALIKSPGDTSFFYILMPILKA